MKRRHFLAQASLASVGAGLASAAPTASQISPIIAFEKPMQKLAYDRMGEELAKMGLQGIEATIRRGGHIDPKNAEAEVPKMVADLAKNGQKALIAASNVNTPDKKSIAYLKTLKANGITKYRMDYYRYDLKKPLLPQVADATSKLRELADLNRELGMQAHYQLHAGPQYAGSLAWDAAMMFADVDPEFTAIAFDLRHMRIGTGLSFDTALAALRKHLGSIYVKDARWTGERSQSAKNVPLDTGIVDQKTFNAVRKGLEALPLSLHMEWGKTQIYPEADVMEAVANFARDAKVLKSWL